MNTRDAISATLDTSMMVLNSYIGDFSDAELMMSPGKGCNHIAWQLGHLIASQCNLLDSIAPGASAKLPDGFAQQHSKDTASNNDPEQFCSKETYVQLFESVNNAVKSALAKTTDADLDKPGPEKFQSMFPTVGNIYVLLATHPMMHVGQIVPVRRALGKPIVI